MTDTGSLQFLSRMPRSARIILLSGLAFLVALLHHSFAGAEPEAAPAQSVNIRKMSKKAWTGLKRSYPLRSINDLAKFEVECIDIATASLIVEKGLNPKIDIEQNLRAIDGIAAAILNDMPAKIDPRAALAIINEHLYDAGSFAPADNMDDPCEAFLHRVLSTRRGNCLGLSTLYLAVGRRLGLRLFLVEAPGHAFVHYADKNLTFNIEATDKGVFVNDDFYRKKFEITPGRPYLRTLTKREELSILLATRGVARFDRGEDDKSIADGTAAIALGSNIALTHSNRGAVWLRSGDYRRAIKDCTRAIELDVKYALAYSNRGAAWVRMKKAAQGMADLTTAVLLDPGDPLIYSNRSAAWFEMGRFRDAINDATRAIALDPRKASAYFNRGRAYLEMGKKRFALRDLRRAGELGMAIDPSLLSTARRSAAD